MFEMLFMQVRLNKALTYLPVPVTLFYSILFDFLEGLTAVSVF